MRKKDRKRVKNKQWKKENMLLAVENVLEKGISIQQSAKRFKVPRSTLRERVRGNVPMDACAGSRKKLDSDQESALAKYIDYMLSIGHPLTLSQVRICAWCIAQTRGSNTFGKHLPSDNWWKLFRQASGPVDLKLRPSKKLKRSNLLFSEDEKDFAEYFRTLKEIMDKYDFHNRPDSVFCCGENIVVFDNISLVAVIPSHVQSQFKFSKDKVTVFQCASAAGLALMPYVVFSGDFPKGDYACGGYYCHSVNGRMNSELMFEWFQNCFLPYCPSDKSRSKPVLLLIDGYSMHVSLKLIELAERENVILLVPVPQSRYTYSPLSMEIFGAMQSELSSAMKICNAMHGDEWDVKEDITKILKMPIGRSMTPDNIRSGFRKCGIWPLDPEAVSKQVPTNLIESEEETDPSIILENVEVDDSALIDFPQTEVTQPGQCSSNGSHNSSISLEHVEENLSHFVDSSTSNSPPPPKKVMRIDILHKVVSSMIIDESRDPDEKEKFPRRRSPRCRSRRKPARIKQVDKAWKIHKKQSQTVNIGASKRQSSSLKTSQRSCHGCMRKWNDDNVEDQTKWVGCSASCCSHWTCGDCLRVDFASAAEAYNVVEYTLDEL